MARSRYQHGHQEVWLARRNYLLLQMDGRRLPGARWPSVSLIASICSRLHGNSAVVYRPRRLPATCIGNGARKVIACCTYPHLVCGLMKYIPTSTHAFPSSSARRAGYATYILTSAGWPRCSTRPLLPQAGRESPGVQPDLIPRRALLHRTRRLSSGVDNLISFVGAQIWYFDAGRHATH